MNLRRAVLALCSFVFLLPAFPAHAQPAEKTWRVGYLTVIVNPLLRERFVQGMRELGYVEGKNLAIAWRLAENRADALAPMAAELAGLKVDIILASGTPAVRAAQKAAPAIPIVMTNVGDPVTDGFVASLARPGGTITGLSINTGDASTKLLELLHQAVPGVRRVAMLVNPDNFSHALVLKDVQAAARGLKLQILPIRARTPQEVVGAFAAMRREKAGALYAAGGAPFAQTAPQAALQQRIPAVFVSRSQAEDGGLMSYGPDLAEQHRRAAVFVDKIFKGAKPGDLPVEQPTKFELVINKTTAKVLGLAIPQVLLLQADEVIE